METTFLNNSPETPETLRIPSKNENISIENIDTLNSNVKKRKNQIKIEKKQKTKKKNILV